MADDHLELAERFFAAIETGDLAAVGDLYAPSAEIWHNHDGLVQDRESNLKTLAWMVANLPHRRYDVIRRSATADGFVQQHVLSATNRAGQNVELPACIICTIADGRIVRLDEYFDSRHAERFADH
ncbi:MAG: nuclear transport factor 2 family protein [Ilumatobacteraceae bacterium]